QSGDAGEEVVSRFESEATAVGAHIYRAAGPEEVAARIVEICLSANITEVVHSGAPMFSELHLVNSLGAKNVRAVEAASLAGSSESDGRRDLVDRLAVSRAGVTGVEYAIAETGTIVLSSDEQHALLVSLLPPIHIALIRASQIKRSIGDALG